MLWKNGTSGNRREKVRQRATHFPYYLERTFQAVVVVLVLVNLVAVEADC